MAAAAGMRGTNAPQAWLPRIPASGRLLRRLGEPCAQGSRAWGDMLTSASALLRWILRSQHGPTHANSHTSAQFSSCVRLAARLVPSSTRTDLLEQQSGEARPTHVVKKAYQDLCGSLPAPAGLSYSVNWLLYFTYARAMGLTILTSLKFSLFARVLTTLGNTR